MLHHQSKYNMTYISNFLAIRNVAATTSSVPSPPSSLVAHSNDVDCITDETELDSINGATGKSFTIAAILGLKKKNAAACAAAAALDTQPKNKELTVMNLSMHNNQHLTQTQSHHMRAALNNYDGVSDARLLANRIPIPFCHHNPNHSNSHHHSHYLSNNNNNHTTNNNQTSALQTLHQQFHQKSNQNLSPFHGKESRAKNDHTTKNKSSLKSKRVRTIFTPEQLERLEAEFERQQYMVGPERLYLAHTLQLTEAQVKVWFQNRRIKWRKHHLELTQQRLAIIRQRQLPPNASSVENSLSDGGGNIPGAGATLATNSGTNGSSIAASLVAASLDPALSVCTDSVGSSSIHDVEDL